MIEYVGRVACFAGTAQERTFGKEYLAWLIQQKKERVHIDIDSRNDITCIKVPKKAMGYVTGAKGATLRRVELETSTFCFANGNSPTEDANVSEDVIVCSPFVARRDAAEQLIREKIEDYKKTPQERNRNNNRGSSRSSNTSGGSGGRSSKCNLYYYS